MTYQVLARKWRPRQFDQLVGQEHVIQALVNGLDNDRLHHAFLFTGTRGVGKTTIARIFAKSLNCEVGVSSKPCGECMACSEIDQGRFVDLIEVDAASRTKVDDTRDLLENVQYAPSRGRYKVYLIDEVHMLSTHSFNALLKTLEEPPPHVKFLLATTDPQKLPVTILSRCLQFNLKRLSADRIAAYLKGLLSDETVPADEDALALIARSADGSMRDALSLLDQAISYGAGEVRTDEVSAMLGTVERGRVRAVLDAVLADDGNALWRAIEDLAEFAPDYRGLLRELAELLHRVAMAQFVDAGMGEGEDAESVRELASRLSREDVQLYYQIAVHGRRDIELAPDPRSGFEMTLLRMLAFRPGGDGDADPAGRTAARGSAGAGGSPRQARSAAATRQVRDAPANHAIQPEPATPPADPETGTDAPPVPDSDADDWSGLIHRLGLKGTAAVLASNSVLERVGEGHYRIRLSPQQEHLHTPAAEEKIREAMGRLFGQDIRVQFEVVDVAEETPAQRQHRESDERMQAAREAVDRDPVVQELKSTFGAEVIPDSVRPTDH